MDNDNKVLAQRKLVYDSSTKNMHKYKEVGGRLLGRVGMQYLDQDAVGKNPPRKLKMEISIDND